jgi:methylated-DNA-[protein]-cysteine S-methyltransferase
MPESQRSGAAAAAVIYVPSPLGCLRISGSEKGVRKLEFCENPGPEPKEVPDCLRLAGTQLEEYFQGRRLDFDLPLDLRGTAFQIKVWAALREVPYSHTVSYGSIAGAIGRPKSSRAVGGANHRNPVAIIVPCHRIIGHDGRLTGYGGGLWRKQWLLDHERKSVARGQSREAEPSLDF